MVKRTLHFSNPAHLSFQHEQLLIELKDELRTCKTIPIEDIGVVILEHPQITLSMKVLDALIKANVAIVSCDDHYMPSGIFLPLEGHNTQTEHTQPIECQRTLEKTVVAANHQNQNRKPSQGLG